MMLASSLTNIGIVDAAIVAVLGYAVVFFGLILLMGVIILMGKAFMARDKKAAEKAAAAKDVLSYIAVPNLAEKFLEERKAKEENVATYTIVEC